MQYWLGNVSVFEFEIKYYSGQPPPLPSMWRPKTRPAGLNGLIPLQRSV